MERSRRIHDHGTSNPDPDRTVPHLAAPDPDRTVPHLAAPTLRVPAPAPQSPKVRDPGTPDLKTMAMKVLALWILRMRISTTRIVLVLALTVLAATTTIIAAGAVFAKIADDVVDQNGVSSLDPRLSGWVVAHRPASLVPLVEYLTFLADPPVLLVLSLLAGGWLTWRRSTAVPLILMLAASGGGIAIGMAMKFFVQRERPPVDWRAVPETGFSFPSLHTLTATAALGMLAYLSPPVWSQLRRTTMALLALVGAIAAGSTRVFLTVHWPSDVAASFALGIAWLALLIAVHTVVTALTARRPPASWLETRPVRHQPAPR